jgi:hypothetical protein
LEHYVDRQREIGSQIFFCSQAMDKVRRYTEIAIGGDPVPISDDTRPMLLEFLTLTKLELEREARNMELTLRIGTEEEEEVEEEDEDIEFPVLKNEKPPLARRQSEEEPGAGTPGLILPQEGLGCQKLRHS